MKSTPKSRPPILLNFFAISPSSPGQLLKRKGIRLLDTSIHRLRVALNQKLNMKKKKKKKKTTHTQKLSKAKNIQILESPAYKQ